MLLKKDIEKLFEKLRYEESIQLRIDGSELWLRILDKSDKLSLATPVYYGGNYIPKSVRQCLTKKAPFNSPTIKTYLTVDEQNYQINLNYLGTFEAVQGPIFKDLLEEFLGHAEDWRQYLDKHDKNDLLYIPVK